MREWLVLVLATSLLVGCSRVEASGGEVFQEPVKALSGRFQVAFGQKPPASGLEQFERSGKMVLPRIGFGQAQQHLQVIRMGLAQPFKQLGRRAILAVFPVFIGPTEILLKLLLGNLKLVKPSQLVLQSRQLGVLGR